MLAPSDWNALSWELRILLSIVEFNKFLIKALFNCIKVALFNCVKVALFNCVKVALFNCVKEALFNCVKVALFNCVKVALFNYVRSSFSQHFYTEAAFVVCIRTKLTEL